MTPHSLMNLVLKVLGLFLTFQLVALLPLSIAWFSAMIFYDMHSAFYMVLLSAITGGVLLLLMYLLIFQTNWVIAKMKLAEHFDQEVIGFNIHRSTILAIAIIILGGWLVIEFAPNFLWELIAYAQSKPLNKFVGFKYPLENLLIPLAKTGIGLAMMYYNRTIVNWIELRRRDGA